MPICSDCGRVCKGENGLARHKKSDQCNRPVRRPLSIASARATPPGPSLGQTERARIPLPINAGGSGGRRVADNLNPVQHSPGNLSHWQVQETLAAQAAHDRELRNHLFAEPGNSLETFAPHPDEGSGHAELEDRIEAESDTDEEEARGAEDATGQEIRDAILQLARQNAEKAGAKLVNRFLRLLQLKNLPEAAKLLESEGLENVADMTREVDLEVQDSMKERGFREVWVANPDNTDEGVCIYLRSPVGVIERQLTRATVKKQHTRNMYFEPLKFECRKSGEPTRTHPMSGDLANNVYKLVRSEVMKSSDRAAVWETDASFMCMLQVYSDKSAMSLSTKAHVFYPLHIAVLNLKSELKDSIIRKGETVVAYLSTSSKWCQIPNGSEILQARPLRSFSQDTSVSGAPASFMDTDNSNETSQINKILFRCTIAAVLGEVRDIALRGLRFTDSDSTPRRAHMVLAAYSGDAPELHLVTCTKQFGCARCSINGTRLSEAGAVGAMRTVPETMKRLQTLYRLEGPPKTAARNDMWGAGLSTIEPGLVGWPFMSIPGLDMYEITRFDLLHSGPLGVLKHVLRAVRERTKSDTLWTPHVSDANGNPKTFSSISTRVLRACNNYVHEVDRESPAVGFSVNFGRGKKKKQLDGLFTEDGIASMLEGKDYRMMQEVLPFVGVLIDRYLGKGYEMMEGEAMPTLPRAHPIVTNVFVLYQNMDQEIRRKDMEDVGFTDAAIQELRKAVEKFQKHILDVLGPFQKSGFNFSKWHAYNHLTSDICALGLPSGFDTSPFEAAHTVYKASSRATSQRHGTATADATAILSRNECMSAALNEKTATSASARIVHELVSGAPKRGLKVPRTVREAVDDDVGVLPKNGLPFNWDRLSRLINRSYDENKEMSELLSQQPPNVAQNMKEFLDQLHELPLAYKALKVIGQKVVGGDGELILESEDVKTLTPSEKRWLHTTVSVTILKSARVPGHPAPSLSHLQDDGSVILPGGGCGYRIMQRIICSASFSHRKRLFQECVMIDGNPERESQEATGSTHASLSDQCRVEEPYEWETWFAKALAFLRIKAALGPLSSGTGEEFVVVQYFDVIQSSELDPVDLATDCIKLRWAVDPSCGESGEREPWIDVVPASSIRGCVHVVDEPYIQNERDEPRDWTKKAFYLNKYKISNYDPTYHTKDREQLKL